MAQSDERLAGTVVGRIVSSEVDVDGGLKTIMELEPLMYELAVPFAPGKVDDGPDSWAFIFVAAIVSLAIAVAFFVEGLI